MKEYNDITYLAALVDGEGTIGINKSRGRHYSLFLSIGNTSEELIDYLKNEYGGMKHGPYTPKLKNARNVFEWKCSNRKAINLIKKILPYLNIKQLQASLAIESWEDTFRINYRNGMNRMPKFALDKREYYHAQMKQLNVKGKQEQYEQNETEQKENYSNTNNILMIQYLAGIIDGEGTIGIKKSRNIHYSILLSVSNTSKSLIVYLKENFDGSMSGPHSQKKENEKDRFEWQCSGKKAIKLIKRVQPYLIVKHKQAELAIEAWNDTFIINYNSGTNRIPQYAIYKREKYFLDMRKLNKKGIHQEDEEIEITLKINRNTLQQWLEESE